MIITEEVSQTVMKPVKYVKKVKIYDDSRFLSDGRFALPPPGCGYQNQWGGDAQPSSLPRGLHDKCHTDWQQQQQKNELYHQYCCLLLRKKKATIFAAI